MTYTVRLVPFYVANSKPPKDVAKYKSLNQARREACINYGRYVTSGKWFIDILDSNGKFVGGINFLLLDGRDHLLWWTPSKEWIFIKKDGSLGRTVDDWEKEYYK